MRYNAQLFNLYGTVVDDPGNVPNTWIEAGCQQNYRKFLSKYANKVLVKNREIQNMCHVIALDYKCKCYSWGLVTYTDNINVMSRILTEMEVTFPSGHQRLNKKKKERKIYLCSPRNNLIALWLEKKSWFSSLSTENAWFNTTRFPFLSRS